jgi:hypothetical protein
MFHNSKLRFVVRPNAGMDVEGGIAGLPDDRSSIKNRERLKRSRLFA